MKNISKTGLVVLAAVLLATLTVGTATAQDTLRVAPLEKMPEASAAPPIRSEPLEQDGENFDGEGPIDRVGVGEVVIADLRWKVSPDVTYFKKPIGFPAMASEFAPGAYVGYYVDENRVITSLWLIEPAPR